MTAISVTANRITQPCGCGSWMQWDEPTHRWVLRALTCSKHLRTP